MLEAEKEKMGSPSCKTETRERWLWSLISAVSLPCTCSTTKRVCYYLIIQFWAKIFSHQLLLVKLGIPTQSQQIMIYWDLLPVSCKLQAVYSSRTYFSPQPLTYIKIHIKADLKLQNPPYTFTHPRTTTNYTILKRARTRTLSTTLYIKLRPLKWALKNAIYCHLKNYVYCRSRNLMKS